MIASRMVLYSNVGKCARKGRFYNNRATHLKSESLTASSKAIMWFWMFNREYYQSSVYRYTAANFSHMPHFYDYVIIGSTSFSRLSGAVFSIFVSFFDETTLLIGVTIDSGPSL